MRQALAYFERQDYPNRELIIVDDGDDRVSDLISPDSQVRYLTVPQNTSIGAKRNIACEQARGDIIAHWDDDDWYAPHRLEHQIAPLLAKQADMTGLETSRFFDLTKWEAWTCSPDLHRRLFVADGYYAPRQTAGALGGDRHDPALVRRSVAYPHRPR